MYFQQMPCPNCERPVLLNLGSFPLSSSDNQKFHVQCPLCQNGFFFGYIAETYRKSFARLAQESDAQERRESSLVSRGREVRSRSGGVTSTTDRQRSNGVNPNNPAYRAASA